MTFTVLARDPASGLIGAATASRSLAAGNAVIEAHPGVGAVASQAWTNRSLRGLLLQALAAGDSAEAAVARVPEWDERPALRQVAVLPVAGAGAARSGEEISAWAGHHVNADGVVAGNLLAGRDVLQAMSDRLADVRVAAGEPDAAAVFAAELVEVLAAGESYGGDARGRQSAAVLVATVETAGDVRVDLRVDDHADPIAELGRLVELRRRDLLEKVSARRA